MLTRIAITIGIVFLMVQKPALLTSVLTIALAAAAGATVGLISGRRAVGERDRQHLPPEPIRRLRTDTRYRRPLTQARTSEKQRVEKLLEHGH